MFISDGAQRFDVMQGELGNCWLLAAVANLTLNDKLFQRVVPHDQTFDKPEYAGIFHFRFWQYGRWVDVVVDDRLPTTNGHLMLMHSKDRHEFWSALIEKAYAKLHGSYEALKGGTTSEAMEDFTGGLTENFELQSNECPPNLLNIMLKAFERSSFLGCSIEALDSSQMEAEMSNGLIRGHAYSVTAIKLVQLSTAKVKGKIPLIRVRNPWGNEAEWKGAWSDKSREWTVVPEREKQQLGLTFDADGEFWMSFTDFKNNFTRLEICNLSPDSLDEDNKRRWEVSYFEGSWVRGISAGGCRNNLQTFHLNPQYLISLVDIDEDDDEDYCTCVVALMQKNHRLKRKMGSDSLTIGFAIYEVKDGHTVTDGGPKYESKFIRKQCQLLTTEYFKYNQSVARSPTFVNLREISGRFRLKPGKYCIIPSTFDPGEEGEFLIRFFTEKPPQSVEENDEEIGLVDKDSGKTNGISDNLVADNEPKESEPTDNNVANNDNNVDLIHTILSVINILSQCWTLCNNREVVRTCVVALMQKNHRLKRKMGSDSLTIGFAIYEVKDGHTVTDGGPKYESKFIRKQCQLLTTEYFKYNQSVARSPTFVNLREISGRFRLKPGKYCIIPSTFDPGEEGEFLIRFFTEKPPQSVEENDEEIGLVDKDSGKTNGISDNLVADNEPKESEPTDNNVANNDNNVDLIHTILSVINILSQCWTLCNNREVTENVAQNRAKEAESQINTFFAKLAGEDMEVDANELQEIMNHALKKGIHYISLKSLNTNCLMSLTLLT
ncbi:unnamed protein product, partial [Oppiella nova]